MKKSDKIDEVLAKVRPYLEMHGGDVEVVKFDKKTKALHLRLMGTCAHCSISQLTLKGLIEKEVLKNCPEIKSVVAEPIY